MWKNSCCVWWGKLNFSSSYNTRIMINNSFISFSYYAFLWTSHPLIPLRSRVWYALIHSFIFIYFIHSCKKHITVYHQQTRCRWWWYILLRCLLLPPKRPRNRKLWSLSWICYVYTLYQTRLEEIIYWNKYQINIFVFFSQSTWKWFLRKVCGNSI